VIVGAERRVECCGGHDTTNLVDARPLVDSGPS
jgi:hypothetical protein